MKKNPKGFSLIELLFAGAVFVVFATGVVEVLIFGLETDRLGEETTIATQYATQAMEAIRSMRAKNFDDLTLTNATGLARVNGNWVLSGTDNRNNKYTRVITITEVNRDESGKIDENNGSTDTDTKKIRVTVSWKVTPSRPDSVVLETYLTHFQ